MGAAEAEAGVGDREQGVGAVQELEVDADSGAGRGEAADAAWGREGSASVPNAAPQSHIPRAFPAQR